MLDSSFSRRRVGPTTPPPSSSTPPSPVVTTSTHSHVSTYRSSHIEMQIYSSTVQVQEEKRGSWGPLAIFSDSEQVSGRVVLDSMCGHSGRLSVSIEGAFIYPPMLNESAGFNIVVPKSGERKHVFFSSSTVIQVTQTFEAAPRSAFRDVVASVRRKPSNSTLALGPVSTIERSYPFLFELPRSCRSGEEMPPTCSSKGEDVEEGEFEVAYKVIATWDAYGNADNSSCLEAPIVFHPDPEFHSVDLQGLNTNSWLEMPLRADRPVPFRCAVTLPTSVTFSRNSSIPFFVVFTTTPRSPSLAREIASDATISVTLQRQIVITETVSLPSPPQTPSSSGEENEAPQLKLLKRLRRRAKTLEDISATSESQAKSVDKPLPRLPTETVFSDSRTLRNNFCIGFPKRPRHPCEEGSHPPLESYAALPDGLHKSKIRLGKTMMPCIDWAGVSVKYYLDVSVLIGQDDLRARIPIRVY